MYEEFVKELRDSAEWADRLALLMGRAEGDVHAPAMRKAADVIEGLSRRSDPMKRKRYLFHVTDPENLPSILLGGLKRGGGIRQAAAVYLSEKPLSWYQPGLDILRVDVSGLDGIKATTFLPDSDEVLFWGDIPAWKATKGGWRPRFELVTNKYVKMDGGVNDGRD